MDQLPDIGTDAESTGGSHYTCHRVRVRVFAQTPLHTHRHHELVFVRKGSAIQWLSGESTRLEANDVVLVPALACHYTNGIRGHTAVVDCVKIDEVMFAEQSRSDVEARRILRHLGKLAVRTCGALPLTKKTRQEVGDLMRRLMRESRQQRLGFYCAVKASIYELLLCLARDSHLEADSNESLRATPVPDRMDKALDFIASNYMEKIQVRDAAESVNISAGHFQHLFKTRTGTTFVEYLNGVRLAHAKDLLETSNEPIMAIALSCGFPSLAHFYHLFRKTEGVTPKRFRSQNR